MKRAVALIAACVALSGCLTGRRMTTVPTPLRETQWRDIKETLDALTKEVAKLSPQNDETKKAIEDTNLRLALIASAVGVPDKDGKYLVRMPTQWEYQFVRSRSDKHATKLGADGWELVAVFDKQDYFLYKRPVPAKPADAGGQP